MKNIALYELMSRRTRLPYRGKIMLMAFVGTHVPLIALIAYVDECLGKQGDLFG